MADGMSRRGFIVAGAGFGIATGFLGLVPSGADAQDAAPPGNALHDDFPRQEAQVVAEVVGASHAKIDRVRELVSARPALAKAAWDWGFGDWETALGAASHVGRADIAALLIEHGARPDLFTFAALGNVDAVRAAIGAHPGLQRLHGPHGITLMAHARTAAAREGATPAEEQRARDLVEYLESLGGADDRAPDLPMTDEAKAALIGTYRFGEGE